MPARNSTQDREYPNKLTLGLSDEASDILTDLVAHFKKGRTRRSTAGGVIDALLVIAKRDGSGMNDRIESLLPMRSKSVIKKSTAGSKGTKPRVRPNSRAEK